MTTALVTQEREELSLVALSPAELPATQAALVNWCDKTLAALHAELADLEEHRLIATANKWSLKGLQASIRRVGHNLTYYQKLKTAVEEGYLIVPNMPMTVVAVRVPEKTPQPRHSEHSGGWAFRVEPASLPVGEGQYVADRMPEKDESYMKGPTEAGKKPERQSFYGAYEYGAPEFPFRAVKPEIIAATSDAMQKKIFDSIGVVHDQRLGRKGDPVMVGRIINPNGNRRSATFFLGWWLDTRTL